MLFKAARFNKNLFLDTVNAISNIFYRFIATWESLKDILLAVNKCSYVFLLRKAYPLSCQDDTQ